MELSFAMLLALAAFGLVIVAHPKVDGPETVWLAFLLVGVLMAATELPVVPASSATVVATR